MIEPIIIGKGDGFERTIEKARLSGERNIFYIDNGIVNFLDILKTPRAGPHYNIFATIKIDSRTVYWFDGMMCKRETFIGSVMRDYPDHFEWYLFHPEHLLPSY